MAPPSPHLTVAQHSVHTDTPQHQSLCQQCIPLQNKTRTRTIPSRSLLQPCSIHMDKGYRTRPFRHLARLNSQSRPQTLAQVRCLNQRPPKPTSQKRPLHQTSSPRTRVHRRHQSHSNAAQRQNSSSFHRHHRCKHPRPNLHRSHRSLPYHIK